jgi:tetratricopeptide (TPR) repeat protein
MNQPSTPATQSGADAPVVDAQRPWLGLASFNEETGNYFFGRETEVAELARRVQRKLLTILFGQSGLGKTSILRAGIVPRLRREGYCPVYVRIDYSASAPAPSEQIKQAIYRATSGSGQWTQIGVAMEGESLWEFLHHRDDVLKDEHGNKLTPLLIFDQFEEIFTLAQSDAAGRQRAEEFVRDLADLVENRPPAALEKLLDADDTAADRFDFTRGDYRVLIALREDYLAHLESLKNAMPSVSQNRMRLARMNGEQALAAVLGPGRSLVSPEVAEAIVRHVAGGAELRNAEVEPSLLSLVCRELNDARLAQGRSEISADLLAGSQVGILSDFYERALADQPDAVRRVIEDELLTESGYRENVAEERVLRALADAGASPQTLATLVDRRLLRIEERLDLRRVELTHDVLCAVVGASRARRKDREAREATERQLAEQQAREQATRTALKRARLVAAGCLVLAAGALVATVLAVVGMRRASQAEAQAQEIRIQAETARTQAEQLLSFLMDDFALELEPVGRLDVVASLAGQAIAYYDALPPALRNATTARNKALAQVRYGIAMRNRSELGKARQSLGEAVDTLTAARAAGDTSEATKIGLALGWSAQAATADSLNEYGKTVELGKQAAALLKPADPDTVPSVPLGRAYGRVLIRLGYAQMRSQDREGAVRTLTEARKTLAAIGAVAMADLNAASLYAEAGAWQVEALTAVGRPDEARKIGMEAFTVASQVLERRPGHMVALRARALATSSMTFADAQQSRLRDAAQDARTCIGDWDLMVRLDPGNAIAVGNAAACRTQLSNALGALGAPRDSLAIFKELISKVDQVSVDDPARFFGATGVMFEALGLAVELDDTNFTGQITNAIPGRCAVGAARPGAGDGEKMWYRTCVDRMRAYTGFLRGDAAQASQLTQAVLAQAAKVKPESEAAAQQLRSFNYAMNTNLVQMAFENGDDDLAQTAAKSAISLAPPLDFRYFREELAETRIWLSLSLARQGKTAEAQKEIAPVLGYFASIAGPAQEDQFTRLRYAMALYAQAQVEPSKRAVLLSQATAILASLPAQMQSMRSVRKWRAWVAGTA